MKSKKKLISIGLVVILLLGVGTLTIYAEDVKEKSNMRSQKAEAMLKKAEELRKRHKYKEAIIGYQEIVDSYPEDNIADEAQYTIGEILAQRGNYSQAIKEFQKVIKKHTIYEGIKKKDRLPLSVAIKSWDGIIYSYLQLREYEKAQETLREKTRNYPQISIQKEVKKLEKIINEKKLKDPEENKIKETLFNFVKALEARDIQLIKLYYHPSSQKVSEALEYVNTHSNIKITISNLNISIYDDTAHVFSDMSMKASPSTDDAEGENLIILKKKGKEWKIIQF